MAASTSLVPRSHVLRRRVLFLIAALVVLVLFSYGWTVTQINLEVPQEPLRLQNVGNTMRELLSPNVFTQDYRVEIFTTEFTIGCPEGFAQATVNDIATPYIVVEPACADANEPIIVRGFNFVGNTLARLTWIGTDEERRIRQVAGDDNFVMNADGTFAVEIEVPRIRGSAGETHTIELQARFKDGLPRVSESTLRVIEKMTETIFLALIATAISILPSTILSFFAAHNLMRPIRTPAGNLLIGVVLLPFGWLLGTTLLALLGEFSLNIGRSGIGILVIIGLVVLRFMLPVKVAETEKRTEIRSGIQWGAMLNVVIFALVVIAGMGILGGLGIFVGNALRPGLDNYVGREIVDIFDGIVLVTPLLVGLVGAFFVSIGELIVLIMPALAGLIGAFTLASIGTTLTREWLKHISPTTGHLLGAVLGAVAGAFLMAFFASIGMIAAWTGLLVPFTASAMAGPLLPMLYRHFGGLPVVPSSSQAFMLRALGWAGSIAAFIITFWLMNIGQAVVEDVMPPRIEAFSIGELIIYQYVAQAMLIGVVLGGASGGLAGTKRNFPIGTVLYNVTRTILNLLRSIEPLIMGIVFVIWVGIGPFAGVLALTLHSIASLGKLYSEQIESIDTGPIEALQSTGANHLQTIIYAVVPQIVPPYIAFTMYRWDINVRMSTIIGFVGGGGIGFLLQQQINLLRYREAGVAVLAIAIVVSILDYASAAIRERYT